MRRFEWCTVILVVMVIAKCYGDSGKCEMVYGNGVVMVNMVL